MVFCFLFFFVRAIAVEGTPVRRRVCLCCVFSFFPFDIAFGTEAVLKFCDVLEFYSP